MASAPATGATCSGSSSTSVSSTGDASGLATTGPLAAATASAAELRQRLGDCERRITHLRRRLRETDAEHEALQRQLYLVCQHEFEMDRSHSDPCSRSYVCKHCHMQGGPAERWRQGKE